MRSFTLGGESRPKSGKSRSVPMVADVAQSLARLSHAFAEESPGPQDHDQSERALPERR